MAQIARVREQEEQAFMTAYPFVDREALRTWKLTAADSTRDSSRALAAFLESQRGAYKQRIADSIKLAREMREYALAQEREWRQDSINRAIEQRRAALQEARQQAAVVPPIELDIDIEQPEKHRSRTSKRGRKSSSSSSYSGSSGSSYSSGSYRSSSSRSSYSSGGSGRRGGRRR